MTPVQQNVKIRNLATIMKHHPKNGYMGDTEPSDNTLHKTKHTRSSILSYRVGLDIVAIPYHVGWIERTRNIPC